jgi:hypothetical protein
MCLIFIPPLPGRGVYCFTSVRLSVLPSVQGIFRRIFLSNCWWQKSDIWSQASYMYTIYGSVFGPVRFLLPVCRLSWSLYTLNIQCSLGLSPNSPIAKIHVCPDFPHYKYPVILPNSATAIRHSFSDTKVVKPIQIPPLVPPTTTFWQLCIDL